LQGLFVLALAWTGLGTAFLLPERWSKGPVFGAEGEAIHRFVEDFFPPLVALVVAGIVALVLFRLVPRFLRVPEASSVGRVVFRLLVAVPVVFVALLVFFIALGLVLDPPPWDSENPQYIPQVFFLATFGPAWLAPLATVIAAGIWTRRKDGRSERR